MPRGRTKSQTARPGGALLRLFRQRKHRRQRSLQRQRQEPKTTTARRAGRQRCGPRGPSAGALPLCPRRRPFCCLAWPRRSEYADCGGRSIRLGVGPAVLHCHARLARAPAGACDLRSWVECHLFGQALAASPSGREAIGRAWCHAARGRRIGREVRLRPHARGDSSVGCKRRWIRAPLQGGGTRWAVR